MNFQDFEKLRETIRYGSFTPAQLILLWGATAFRICDLEEFAHAKQEVSDIEELLVESLDKYEEEHAKPYEPDPELVAHE